MSYDALGETSLDYLPCRYGNSRLLFRGPCKRLDEPYVAFMGGTETYGRFIGEPFVALLDRELGPSCVNFGCVNAGVDVFLRDPFMAQAAAGAEAVVLQVPGALNLSNRLYTVHPRRNDRFVAATRIMQSVFPDVDFAEFHFTKHMLNKLREVSPERFDIVAAELEQAWVARMKALLQHLDSRVVLTWISHRAPSDTERLDVDPMNVTRKMLDQVVSEACEFVEVKLSPEALENPLDGMVVNELEKPVAQNMLGPRAHHEIADTLRPVLDRILG